MSDFNFTYIIKVISALFTFALLVFVYTYLTSLEEKGCECAASPNATFIKGFTLFSLIYLLFTMFIPESAIQEQFGNNILILYKFIDIIFLIVFTYYLYVVFQYTRYLVNEKCKCSTDMRREFIMIGSLIEFGLIFMLFIVHVIALTTFIVIGNVLVVVSDNVENIRNVIRDPVSSIKKIPETIKKESNNIKEYISKTKDTIKTIGTRKTRR